MRERKIVKCIDCGKEFPRKELNHKFRCQECRMKILGDNMGQLMAHQGPHYDKWKASMIAATAKL